MFTFPVLDIWGLLNEDLINSAMGEIERMGVKL